MEFRHPKYYKELRKLRNKLDPAISDSTATANDSVRPGRGQSGKQQAVDLKINLERVRKQYTSNKHQAVSDERQATSEGKLQATSSKRQASE